MSICVNARATSLHVNSCQSAQVPQLETVIAGEFCVTLESTMAGKTPGSFAKLVKDKNDKTDKKEKKAKKDKNDKTVKEEQDKNVEKWQAAAAAVASSGGLPALETQQDGEETFHLLHRMQQQLESQDCGSIMAGAYAEHRRRQRSNGSLPPGGPPPPPPGAGTEDGTQSDISEAATTPSEWRSPHRAGGRAGGAGPLPSRPLRAFDYRQVVIELDRCKILIDQ